MNIHKNKSLHKGFIFSKRIFPAVGLLLLVTQTGCSQLSIPLCAAGKHKKKDTSINKKINIPVPESPQYVTDQEVVKKSNTFKKRFITKFSFFKFKKEKKLDSGKIQAFGQDNNDNKETLPDSDNSKDCWEISKDYSGNQIHWYWQIEFFNEDKEGKLIKQSEVKNN